MKLNRKLIKQGKNWLLEIDYEILQELNINPSEDKFDYEIIEKTMFIRKAKK